ncbi:UNVERIFIED_CONTAM: hypothetical protein K2H54_008267 [Gekko kuhli]
MDPDLVWQPLNGNRSVPSEVENMNSFLEVWRGLYVSRPLCLCARAHGDCGTIRCPASLDRRQNGLSALGRRRHKLGDWMETARSEGCETALASWTSFVLLTTILKTTDYWAQ